MYAYIYVYMICSIHKNCPCFFLFSLLYLIYLLSPSPLLSSLLTSSLLLISSHLSSSLPLIDLSLCPASIQFINSIYLLQLLPIPYKQTNNGASIPHTLLSSPLPLCRCIYD